MTDIDLDALAALEEKATGGPWRLIAEPVDTVTGEGGELSLCGPDEHDSIVWSFASDNDADAEFIAAIRTAAPALIARIQELEAEVADYRRTLTFGVDCMNCARLLEKLAEAEAEVERLRDELGHLRLSRAELADEAQRLRSWRDSLADRSGKADS